MNTPDPTAVPLDRDAVHRLVEEVLRRIRGAAPATGPVGLAASPVAVPVAAAGVAIPDRVITLAHVEKLSAGVRVAIAPGAVITPSARDRAREAGIEFLRGTGVAPQPRPFLVAQAACGSHAAARAAAVARAVPAAQQLPASGLADVIAALALHASRDATRAVLLTGRPALAAVLANRSVSLRAVTARDPATLAAAAAECGANLLVVDPAAFPGAALERLCAEFARAGTTTVPGELVASAPAGCGCKTHAH